MKTTTFDKYDYLGSLIDDVKDYIEENEINIEEKDQSDLYDELFCEDYITGNGTFNGYPYFDPFMIENNMDLFYQAMYEFWYNDINKAIKDYKARGGYDEKIYIDWTTRCFLLRDAIAKVYDELKK